ncbi:DUF4148 domain-containing protein [Paraburkholderia sp. BCC1886]|uniref:DUF4148 domain-containing protein n=1 Tax=Paraburkholderia sp. BCC1886 TaxID=2562670 RepID=UPI001642DEF8|nr:DUF4148 domain-containing protein [Paraburkholderia sp. BCC1886]
MQVGIGKYVLTGAVVGAVAIGAYIMIPEPMHRSMDDLDATSGETSAPATRASTVNQTPGATTSGVVTREPRAIGTTDASAVTAMEPAPTVEQERPPMLKTSQSANVAARAGAHRGAVHASRAPGRSTRARVTTQAQANKAGEPTFFDAARGGRVTSAPAVPSPVVNRAAAATPQPPLIQTAQPTTLPTTVPPRLAVEPTQQASTAPSASAAPPGGTVIKSEDGPKTRAQVRAEIVRARADGDLPAFGNPDPAGPGGAPSMTTTLRP